jgi:hypothetical protein
MVTTFETERRQGQEGRLSESLGNECWGSCASPDACKSVVWGDGRVYRPTTPPEGLRPTILCH